MLLILSESSRLYGEMKTNSEKLTNAIFAYLIAWLVAVSLQSIWNYGSDRFYAKQGHDYWANYLTVTPTSETFEYGEHPSFISVVQHYRPTSFEWNDVLMCDLKNNGQFSYFINYETKSKEIDRGEGVVTSNPWVFGDALYVSPPVGSTCYLRSEINMCPEVITTSKRPCRLQIYKGTEFSITNNIHGNK